MSRVRLPAIALFVFAAFAAHAQAPETVATAPPAAPPAAQGATSVADQIDAYLKSSPALALPKDGPAGVTSSADEPRQAHGFVDVAVGSNGYRSAYVQSDLPVGKTGTLSIGVGETRFKGRFGSYGGAYGGRFGAGDRQSLALGLDLGGDAAPDPLDPRCRPPGEEGAAPRLDQRIEGGRPLACHAASQRSLP